MIFDTSQFNSFSISHELTPWFQIESVSDGALEESNHVGWQLIWVVEEHIVAWVVQLKDLRASWLIEPIVLHYGVRAFGRAEKVACSIHEGDREVKVLHHSLLGVERSMQEAEV